MRNNRTRTLSPLESRVVLALEWEERPVVSRGEIVELLDGSPQRADKVIRALRKKKWLERISGGRYLLIPADRGPEGIPESNMLALGRYLVEPYYFAYVTAAAHYRFTPQSRSTVWIATTKTVSNLHLRGTFFRFVRLVARKFFGYRPTQVFEEEVNLSDPEKTVLDCVDRPENAGGIGEVTRIIVNATRRLNWDLFCEYASRFKSVATIQRFGYLAQTLGVEIPDESVQRLRVSIKPNSRSFLGSTVKWGTEGHYDSEWQVIVNVPMHEIKSEL
jgi:predicted transcriptional regulator of viral defense system